MTYDEQKLTALLAPMREHLDEMDARIQRAEAELAELRVPRNRLAAAIRALDPPPKVEKPSSPKPQSGAGMAVSEASLGEMTMWLREHETNGDGFWAMKLVEDPLFTVFESDSGVRNALHVLHERGSIALDRKGQGGRRIYKVVTEA